MPRKILLASLISLLSCPVFAAKPTPAAGYPIEPVPFTAVKVSDSFWGPRLKASHEVTIPLAFSKCEETGRYKAFERAAHPCDTFTIDPATFPFDDTDVFKTIEGASYSLQTYTDPRLEAYIDSVLEIVAAAQEPDGYLYTARTINPAHPHPWAGSKRWESVEELSHEFYNLGHMVEGAVAHWQATGKRNFLDIAMRYADCVCKAIGSGPGQIEKVPGHQIAEMALARLYLATGEKRYLDQARFFLDRRGHTSRTDAYSQAHKPVTEQDEAVGHAVRAAYMYAGMADVAALTGDSSYIKAVDRIWDNIVGRKLYITGGIGARHRGESFGDNYELPNASAYCETCAAIGNVYVNHRLFLLHGDAKYYDVLERTLYNGLISGVSIDGGSFFYPNPLESHGEHQRQPWFGCACCPSNISRFIPSLPGYVYAVKDREVYVNLFMGNAATLEVGGKKVELSQRTEYPYKGDVTISIDKNKAGAFALKIRVPGWARNSAVPSDLYSYSDGKQPGYSVSVNGERVATKPEKGYITIERRWKKGDKIELKLDMEPRTVRANMAVEADRGRVAFERGPLVYCAEWLDNDCDVLGVLVNGRPQIEVVEQPALLGGLDQLVTDAQTLSRDASGRLVASDVKLTLIPYYAWCHRGPGNMAVWLPQELSVALAAVTGTCAAAQAVPDIDLEISRPDSVLSGKCVLICPGGGYEHLAVHHEGEAVARWFAEHGYVSAILRYRFPKGDCTVPSADSRVAIRYLKEHAGELGVSPDSVGIMGFSAGGHLAATTATLSDSASRPAFQILVYPVISMDAAITHMGSRNNLLGQEAPTELVSRYSLENAVDGNTPPALIMLSADDSLVDPENSIRYFQALRRHKVPAAMFVYPTGGHGWGMNGSFVYREEWLGELLKWLRRGL